MHIALSAIRTCFDSASAAEYTATVPMPSFRHDLNMRHAISPLSATINLVGRFIAADPGQLSESDIRRVNR